MANEFPEATARFNEHGQELAVCKNCGHEIIALSRREDYPSGDGPRNWVHNNPHRNYPHYCVRDTTAEPSNFPENISVEEAERVLAEHGTSAEAVVNNFIERLLRERLALQEAAEAADALIVKLYHEEVIPPLMQYEVDGVREQLRAALHPQPEKTK